MDQTDSGDKSWMRGKPWWGYFAAPIVSGFVGGAILVVGTLLILVEAVAREAKRVDSPS